MKKIILTLIGLITIFIATTFIIAFFIVNNGSFLTNFKFKSVTNTGLDFYVYFSKVKAAVNYDVIVYDSSNVIIYKENIKKTSTTIEFDSLEYEETYKIIVIAYDKDGNKKSINEPYKFVWDELAFSEENNIVIDNNNDYTIYFSGNLNKKKYKLNIKEQDNLLKTININKDTYTIKNSDFKDRVTNYTFEITENNMVVSTLTSYNLMSPVTDMTITSPNDGDMKDYGDISLSFTGGDNASNYLFELYSKDNLIRRKEITDKNVILSSNLFEKSASYKIKITASYFDYLEYSKTSEVNFTINAKETLKPVYSNYNSDLIKSGSIIELKSPDKNATIYYTIDGTDPTEDSIKYTSGIKITKDTVIKTFSKENKKNDSIISTFNYKIGSKNQYKVYLSASNQYNNIGVSSVGYTNEKKEMNDLADYIEKRLESYNVKVYRNEFGDINRWTADSTYLGVDLHLAIHSNASDDHTSYGIETWVNSQESPTYSLAQNIENNLMSIYYNKEDPLANRGVKYASGSLAEVNPNYVPFGILIETAHHDYESDAKWIMENKELIGNTIADSVLKYFQIR